MIEVEGAVGGLIQFFEEVDPKYRHATIDIFLDPALHGRGIGTEALRRIVRQLIDERGHHRITIDPAAANTGAIRTYEKVGFRPVGTLRQAERDADGEGWHDALLMELLAGEELLAEEAGTAAAPADRSLRWNPGGYCDFVRGEIPLYDDLQRALVTATEGLEAERILDLGTGNGETARRVLGAHPGASLVGVDESEQMLAAAGAALDPARVELEIGRLEDDLPSGPFDLAVSALAVHHLDGAGKAELFRRLYAVLRSGGRFVLADVVVPEDPAEAWTPKDPTYDRPSTVADQLGWLQQAGFAPSVAWQRGDLAVLVAERGAERYVTLTAGEGGTLSGVDITHNAAVRDLMDGA